MHAAMHAEAPVRLGWELLKRVTQRAMSNGVLVPLPTSLETLRDSSGVQWIVRVAETLQRKPSGMSDNLPKRNPFLPPEPDLFVAPVRGVHNVVLNKFNVVPHHLLLTTIDFQSQLDKLNVSDFTSLWQVMTDLDMDLLAFYNCGPRSGASQPHKHIQMLPVPFEGTSPPWRFPTEQALLAAAKGLEPAVVFRVPHWTFRHAALRLPDLAPSALDGAYLADCFDKLYNTLQLSEPSQYDLPSSEQVSYNFIMTQRLMVMAPRSRELFQDRLSVNATTLAGTILVKSQNDRELVDRVGPLQVVDGVMYPM